MDGGTGENRRSVMREGGRVDEIGPTVKRQTRRKVKYFLGAGGVVLGVPVGCSKNSVLVQQAQADSDQHQAAGRLHLAAQAGGGTHRLAQMEADTG